VLNDVKTIAGVIREHGALSLVDAISGLLTADLQTDAWGLDVVIAGSQKAFMIPPGLTFCTMSERAWEAYKSAKMARFYWDLGKAKKYYEDRETPWTPAVPQCFALQEAFPIIFADGIEGSFRRHAQHRAAVHAGVKALGLGLFADPSHASAAITAVVPPEGIAADDLRKLCLNKYDVCFAGGQAKLKGKLFRIGHLGYVGPNDIVAALGAVGRALVDLGVKVDPGAGAAAALAAYAEADK
jgi:aspartate aminotransferase-like enzyme